MLYEKSDIKKILVISLTNIGDVVLTFPVVDILKRDFPSAKISIIVGPKAQSLLTKNSNFEMVYVFNKSQHFLRSMKWVWELRNEEFDLVVDLKNSAVPFFLFPKHRTTFFDFIPKQIHMRDKHLMRLKSVYEYKSDLSDIFSLLPTEKDKSYVRKIQLEEIMETRKYVVVAPGSADPNKRWTQQGFAQVSDELSKLYNVKIVFVGDEQDRKIAQQVNKIMESDAVNLCGRSTLIQLAEIIRDSLLTITNDSAPMHLASYLKVPVLAFFGPSDPKKYGPWGPNSFYIQGKEKVTAHKSPFSFRTCARASDSNTL